MSKENFELSYAVIGKAMETHRELGPGLDERFYHESLSSKLKCAGVAHEFKPKAKLIHRNIVADEFEADLLVGRDLVLELKVLWTDFSREHLMQLMCYLKFWAVPTGLLFDFGKESLVHRRHVFTAPECRFDPEAMMAGAPAFVNDTAALRSIALSVDAVLRHHGLGYRDNTYCGLLLADLTASGIPCLRNPPVSIRDSGGPLGETGLPCLLIPGCTAIRISALRDVHAAADRAVLQTCLRHLDLPWGLVLRFGKQSFTYEYVSQPKPRSSQPPHA